MTHTANRRWTEPRWFGGLMFFLGGALYSLSFPHWNLSLLGWLALFPWCWWAKRSGRPRTTFLAGYGMGAWLLLLGIWWLGVLHPSFPIIVSSLEAIAFGLFLLLLKSLMRVLPATLACPMAFLALEWGRGRLPLDGFPFLTLGYSQAPFQTLIQISDIGGVYTVSCVMAVFAGALFDAYEAWRSGAMRGATLRLSLGLLPIALSLGYGAWRSSSIDLEDGAAPTFVAVQGNIAQALKNDNLSADDIFRQYLILTEEALSGADLGACPIVVWPETMFPYWLSREGQPGDVYRRFGNRLHTFETARRLEEVRLVNNLAQEVLEPKGAYGIIGIKLLSGKTPEESRSYNSAVLIDPRGQRLGMVDKSVLVPGGEYIPILRSLPDDWEAEAMAFIRRFAGFVPDLTPGEGPSVMTISKGEIEVPLGITICYENVYPHCTRELTAAGALYLVNISNEAWYGDSAELDQMHDISLFRAIETRRPLVRTTNTGISSVIDPLGNDKVLRVGGRDREVAGVLVETPQTCSERTLYVRWGDWLPLLATILAVIFGLRSSILRRAVTDGEGTPL